MPTTTKKTTTNNGPRAALAKLDDARTLLTTISTALEREHARRTSDLNQPQVGWRHYGDAGRLLEELKTVADLLGIPRNEVIERTWLPRLRDTRRRPTGGGRRRPRPLHRLRRRIHDRLRAGNVAGSFHFGNLRKDHDHGDQDEDHDEEDQHEEDDGRQAGHAEEDGDEAGRDEDQRQDARDEARGEDEGRGRQEAVGSRRGGEGAGRSEGAAQRQDDDRTAWRPRGTGPAPAARRPTRRCTPPSCGRSTRRGTTPASPRPTVVCSPSTSRRRIADATEDCRRRCRQRDRPTAVQRAIDEGYRVARAIDADDLVEVLLAIADAARPAGGQPGRPGGGRRSRGTSSPGGYPRRPTFATCGRSLVGRGSSSRRPPPPPHGPTWANVAAGTRRPPTPLPRSHCSSRSPAPPSRP